MKVVSRLTVASASLLEELGSVVDFREHVEGKPSETEWYVSVAFEALLPLFEAAGFPVLLRNATRSAAEVKEAEEVQAASIAELPPRTQERLFAAQRKAVEGSLLCDRIIDPEHESRLLRELLGAGVVSATAERLFLHPDLPPAPEMAYDFTEAVMDATEDLSSPESSLVAVLHDLASLAAALEHHRPRRTLSGHLDQANTKKLCRWMGQSDGVRFEDQPRWMTALTVLEQLGAVGMEPLSRVLTLEPGMEEVLLGSTPEVLDRMLHRLVPPDLHALLPAIRAALKDAADGAVDEMIFVEELGLQHRTVLYQPWHRDGVDVYPIEPGMMPFDQERFELLEGRALEEVLKLLEKLGLVRLADGVFAPTPDGRLWATGAEPTSPIWVSSDLEVVVPPRSLTPGERYHLEHVGRCISRDVVDRYKLERAGLRKWLTTHEVEDLIALLEARCPGVPRSVVDTLTEWGRAATRVVLTRGVLLDGV